MIETGNRNAGDVVIVESTVRREKKETKENKRLISYLQFFTNTLFTETGC